MKQINNNILYRRLRKAYLAWLIPALVVFVLIVALKALICTEHLWNGLPSITAPVCFILSALFGVALPIFLRTLFANRIRLRKGISEDELLRFERRVIQTVMVTPYLALLAYTVDLPRFHMAGVILIALYAVYYHYPSVRRIAYERRIFKVR